MGQRTKSTADRWMALRLLEYLVAIWNRHLVEHPDTKKLPVIVPLVLHHSERGWTSTTKFSDLVDANEEIFRLVKRFVPDFAFLLDDVSKLRDEELRGRAKLTALARFALMCLARTRPKRSFIGELRRWKDMAEEVLSAPTGLAATEAVFRYILETSETTRDELDDFARQLGPKAEEALMTTAQILQAEARGKAEGKAEGEARGRAELLIKQLGSKFGPLSESITERVTRASVEELDLWALSVLEAKSLDEVFSG
jgi:Putative transposase, YhgA-like/Domain of unknown function (DUF4351)